MLMLMFRLQGVIACSFLCDSGTTTRGTSGSLMRAGSSTMKIYKEVTLPPVPCVSTPDIV